MKILQINNNHYRKSGTDSVYLNLIELLRQHGHDVFTFSFNNSKNASENCDKYFVDHNFFNRSIGKFYSITARKNIEKLILDYKPEIAHFHNIIGGLSSSILPILKKHKLPTVATFHGFKYLCPAYIFINGKGEICEDCKVGKYYNCIINNCAPEGRVKSVALAIESYGRDFFFPFTKYVNKYIFLSRFFFNKYSEFYPSITNKSVSLYNFIDKIKEAPTTAHRGDYFLYFGRLDREKGIKTLIEAFSNNQDIKLKIIGDGQLADYVLKNKTPNVEYLGYQDWKTLQQYLINASFVVVPSECYENNPMTIIESYSLGKPVIGSNIGGIPEIIIPQKTGFIFEPKNVNQLSNLIQLADKLDENSYNQMSKNSFNFAQENFSAEHHYNKLMEIYNSIIN